MLSCDWHLLSSFLFLLGRKGQFPAAVVRRKGRRYCLTASRPRACISNIFFPEVRKWKFALLGVNFALAPGRYILPLRFLLQKVDVARNVDQKHLMIALVMYLSLSYELCLEASCPHCVGLLQRNLHLWL